MKLWKMAPDQITDCFSLLVEQGMKQGDFVFENHFMVLFWRRNAWFGAKNYPKILRSLHTLKYDEHEEFWVDFLPKIKEMVPNLDEPITYDLLEVL
jgi:ribulose bisphosphate carboxylase small subunit